jgi:uncharacterized protein (DUF1778 family)
MTTAGERPTQDNQQDRQTVSINLRAQRAQKDLIDRAAALAHKNRTQFILDAATQAAEDAVLDQRFFVLTRTDYQDFLSRLEAPPTYNRDLAALLGQKAPWET